MSAGHSYAGRRILVAGAGIAGAACARILERLGAQVNVIDRDLDLLDAVCQGSIVVYIGDEVPPGLLERIDDVIVSPGFAPHTPVARAALAAGLPVYSEPELAWRLRPAGAAPWLAVTGTNGKTTTTTMLAAILRAAGRRTAALGNIGEPLVDAAADPARYDVLAVELSSFQLHWSQTMAPPAGALLNLADDHLEWHGTFAAYAEAKTAIWRAAAAGEGVAIGNLDDPAVAARMQGHSRAGGASLRAPQREREAGAVGVARPTGAPSGPRAVGVTLGRPAPGQFGVVDGMLVDHAFGDGPVELAPAAGIRPAGSHNVSNALHAAALARAYGVEPAAVAAGLAGYEPEPHRNALVATIDGVAYVDDSKATNPHAAQASLTAYPRIVWIAGGQLKGVDIDDLVATVAGRLAGVVLLGVDRREIADALQRHAPHIPVREVTRTDDGAMAEVVGAAAAMARAGDTVLLAPAAASKDMFMSYARRGDAFAAHVRALTAGPA